MSTEDLRLLTPTWAGDRHHVELMRASLVRSPLRDVPHELVVQTEDRALFEGLDHPPVRLRTTAEVLPRELEAERRRAHRWQYAVGRTGTRLAGSLTRRAGWPRWPAHTGWHVQQLTKLCVAAAAASEHVVAIDSDVVVTPHATAADFVDPERVVCFTRTGELPASSPNKVRHWNLHAQRLFGGEPPGEGCWEVYFDTPFVFHAPSVRRMLDWLERTYGIAWWQALLRQPPRRWSEFGSYRAFLRRHPPTAGVDWRDDRHMRFVADASDTEALVAHVAALLDDPASHYITIHSQSSGRQLWDATGYAPRILELLPDTAPEHS